MGNQYNINVYCDSLKPVCTACPRVRWVFAASAVFCSQELDVVFKAFDADRNRRLSFHEFIRGIQGSMDDARFDTVSKAFDKLDVDGVGVVTLEDIALCFNPSEDPDVKSGAKSERMVMFSVSPALSCYTSSACCSRCLHVLPFYTPSISHGTQAT